MVRQAHHICVFLGRRGRGVRHTSLLEVARRRLEWEWEGTVIRLAVDFQVGHGWLVFFTPGVDWDGEGAIVCLAS